MTKVAENSIELFRYVCYRKDQSRPLGLILNLFVLNVANPCTAS